MSTWGRWYFMTHSHWRLQDVSRRLGPRLRSCQWRFKTSWDHWIPLIVFKRLENVLRTSSNVMVTSSKRLGVVLRTSWDVLKSIVAFLIKYLWCLRDRYKIPLSGSLTVTWWVLGNDHNTRHSHSQNKINTRCWQNNRRREYISRNRSVKWIPAEMRGSLKSRWPSWRQLKDVGTTQTFHNRLGIVLEPTWNVSGRLGPHMQRR